MINSKNLINDIDGFIQIIDINGKIVYTKASLFQKEEAIELNIGHLSPGVYSVLISDDKDHIFTTKIIIRE